MLFLFFIGRYFYLNKEIDSIKDETNNTQGDEEEENPILIDREDVELLENSFSNEEPEEIDDNFIAQHKVIDIYDKKEKTLSEKLKENEKAIKDSDLFNDIK